MQALRDKDELYLEYLKTYRVSKPLSRLKSPDESFQVFSLKQGLPVKYVSTKDIFDLPMDTQLIGEKGFYRRQKGFYLIPNDYKGKIISFVIRGLTHEYFDVPCMSPVKPIFGWYTFENYKKGKPIIITEGTKDCIVLQQYYPYSLAMLTANITVANVNILKAMTNKVILAYDRDKAGTDAFKRDTAKLKKAGLQVQVIKSHKKDFGEDYQNSNYIEDMVSRTLKNFSRLDVSFLQ